jgi:AbrB family looped-hinge helix DNA binding protein
MGAIVLEVNAGIAILLLYEYDLLYLIKSKEFDMQAKAIVSSKGQVTLPAAMRAKLGLAAGSHIRFELRGQELVIKPELPISAYYGMLKSYNLNPADLEIEKEPDRDFGV